MKKIFSLFIFVFLTIILVACGTEETIDEQDSVKETAENENLENDENVVQDESIDEGMEEDDENNSTANFEIGTIIVEDKSDEELSGLDDDIKFVFEKLLTGEIDDEFYDFISERDKELVADEFDLDTDEELKERYFDLFHPISKDLQDLVKENGDIQKLEPESSLITPIGKDANNVSLQLEMKMIFENNEEEEIGIVFDIIENEVFEFNNIFLYNEMD